MAPQQSPVPAQHLLVAVVSTEKHHSAQAGLCLVRSLCTGLKGQHLLLGLQQNARTIHYTAIHDTKHKEELQTHQGSKLV